MTTGTAIALGTTRERCASTLPQQAISVGLISMPWASLQWPSLALGNLHAILSDHAGVGHVASHYLTFDWAEFLVDRSEGRIGLSEYGSIGDGYIGGLGEWFFKDALYGTIPDEAEILPFVGRSPGQDWIGLDELRLLSASALEFVEAQAATLAALRYDVVGFSSTFLQNVPSLALARHLKRMSPETTIVFGGANCESTQGAALHRNFEFVDFVVRGEGEDTLPRLIAALQGEGEIGSIPGVCWRTVQGRSIANSGQAPETQLDLLPTPRFEDYFERWDRSPFRAAVEPNLVVEASRGCWWGERHHCTFCGLNGETMKYRRKTPERFRSELETLTRQHRVLNVQLADNILDMRYFQTLLPELAASGWDLLIFAEVKSNLTRRQVQRLRRAGVMSIQPGIESLNSVVLKLMDKGVSAVQNVRLLRDCASEGVRVGWNYLYGFPGETDDDYEVMSQLDRLWHLDPPLATYRIALERFSPYFTRPELGLRNLGPSKVYETVYDVPSDELAELVYLFDSEPVGASQEVIDRLIAAAAAWRSEHLHASLSHELRPDGLWVHDNRGAIEIRHHFATPAEIDAYRILSFGASAEELAARVGQCASELLDQLEADRLVFRENDEFVTLSTDPRRMVTWEHAR